MHKTLERQLNKLKRKYITTKRLFAEFTEVVNCTYLSFEKEQRLKDRAIHLMAEELEEVNRQNQEKSEAYISAILDSIVDGVITVSTSGQVLSLNHTATRVIGKGILDMQNQDLVNLLNGYSDFEDFLADLENQEGGRHTVLIENDQKEMIPCTVSISYFDKFEHPLYILIFQDISKQQSAENKIRKLNDDLKDHVKQLEISNKDLESFSYSISHDLRAPLGFVRNFVKILHERNAHQFDSKSENLIEMMGKHIHRMEYLIEDILSFSRSGRKEPDRSNVDIESLVSKVLEQQSSLKMDHRIYVGKLLPAYCDGSLIYQVLVNLVSNAIKYSSKVKEPVIEIGSKRIDNEIVYFVSDNGAGFDEDKSANIFEPFQRLHSEEDFKGTGIGLSIARRIIEKHGGRIWAKGQKNLGAEFFFTLPIPEGAIECNMFVSKGLSDQYQQKENFPNLISMGNY